MKTPSSDTGGSLTLKHLAGKHESKTKFNPCAELTATKVPQEVQKQIATIWAQEKPQPTRIKQLSGKEDFCKFPILAYRSICDTEKFLS